MLEPEPPREEQEVIARINGTPVLRSDFEEYLALSDETPEDESAGDRFQHFLVQLILFQDAEREGYLMAAEQVGDQTAEWEHVRGADRKVVQQWNQRFLTIQAYVASCLDTGSQVNLREMQAYYVEHEPEFVVDERLRVLEILVRDRTQAELLRSRLEPGDFRAFRELAVQYSVGTHADGELGVFEAGQLPSVFEKVIFGLKVGEISPVFSSQSGYHLFTLEERTPRHFQKFYEVQEQIFERLVAQREREAVAAFVQDRIGQAEVEILDEGLAIAWSQREVWRAEYSFG